MISEKLGNLCKITSGGTPSRNKPEFFAGGNIRWVKTGDLGKKFVVEPLERISQLGLDNSSAKVFPANTVLVAMYGATIGSCAILSFEASTNQACAAFLPSQKLNYEYLYYFLKSIKSNLISMGKGGGQPNISAGLLKNVEIPLPPLDDQIRIAHLLGKVEGLIAQRKQHLKQLDDLLKSVFLEMFGDPVRNEKGWDRLPLGNIGSLNRGVSKHRPRNAPELLGGNYPLIQTGEVSNAGTYITTFYNTYSDIGLAQSKLWPSGTLCITIAANIAQTGILTFDACFPDSVVAFTAFENEAHVLYVHGLFWFFQKILEKNAPAAAQKNINLEILRGMEVPKPPIELQSQFAAVVEKVESLKSRYKQSLTDLEALYGTLSQQAFKGELDLLLVPLNLEVVEKETPQ